MDYVGNSEMQMLSETCDEDHHYEDKRINFFRLLPALCFPWARPLFCIGSWTVDQDGALRLPNRPFTLQLYQLKNGGVPTNIDRILSYPATDAYYFDLLACHDSRIRHQPNPLSDEDDGRAPVIAPYAEDESPWSCGVDGSLDQISHDNRSKNSNMGRWYTRNIHLAPILGSLTWCSSTGSSTPWASWVSSYHKRRRQWKLSRVTISAWPTSR